MSRLALAAAGLAIALAGCATTHAPPLAGPSFTGKIAVRAEALDPQPAHAASGQFELSGTPSDGLLELISPLGTEVARARWSRPAGAQGEPTDIVLQADGKDTHFQSLDAMMRQALGDSLPLAAMFDWLAGRPWPAAPSRPAPDGRSFEQLGWHVDLSQFASAQLIAADRPEPLPALHVRVKLDAPAPATVPASEASR